MAPAKWLVVLVALISAPYIASCTSPTRVIVHVDAEPGLQRQITNVVVRGFRMPASATADYEKAIEGSELRWPFTTRVTPLNDDASRRFRVEATATVEDETPPRTRTITVSAISGFSQGRTLGISLFFQEACADVACRDTESCVAGLCQALLVEDAGMLVDAGPNDTSRDAHSDAPPRDAPADASLRTCDHACVWGRCVDGVCDDPIEFSLGGNSACAVRALGEVVCWGSGGLGQIGDGASTPRTRPVTIALSRARIIGVGGDHACAGTESGVYCWGNNDDGQLGDGTTTRRPTPVSVSLSDVTALAGGGSHTCAISSGNVYCWGRNDEGQAGSMGVIHVPTMVSGRTGATQLALGGRFSCSLHSSQVWCWGGNVAGQLGYQGPNTFTPSNVGLLGVTSIAAMGSSVCATLPTGIQCWGSGIFGQLGDGTTMTRSTPSAVTDPTTGPLGSARFSAVGDTACSVSLAGTVHCWGRNYSGATGVDTVGDAVIPRVIPSLAGVVEVRTGGTFGCARLNTGAISCWGDNGQGQLGRGTFTTSGIANPPALVFLPM